MIGAIVAGAGSLLGLDAAEDAEDAQYAATQEALRQTEKQFKPSLGELNRHYQLGRDATARLKQLLGLSKKPVSPEEVMEMDPGYQFRLDEGNRALDYGLRGSRIRNSGAALKEFQRYGQGFATNAFDSIFNRLRGVSDMGLTAAGARTGVRQNYAGTVGNLLTGGANARGAAGIAGANALSQGLGTIGSMYNENQMLNRVMAGRNTGWGGVGASPY